MTKNHYVLLAGTVLSAALSAWVHAGGPNPVYAGIPVVTALFGIISLFTQPPSNGAST